MTYGQRLRIAGIGSVLLHAAVLMSVGHWQTEGRLGLSARTEPLEFRLEAPAPLPVRQLVDTPVASDTPPQALDLISDKNSVATAEHLKDGQDPGPAPEEADELDALAEMPAMPVETPIPPTPMLEPQKAAPESAEAPSIETPPNEAAAPREIPMPAASREAAVQVAASEAAAEKASSDRIEVARADSPPAPAPLPENGLPHASRGRLHDSVKKEGLASFEALQDKIAPYLQEVRRNVERHWNAALLTRYSGTSPREVVVDCSIRPNGELAYVRVFSAGRDRIYAALCKDAIEKAAPFRPFPFEVPDMYRSQNLEIRWTFSFL